MKKHLISIVNRGRRFVFFVNARTDADGKTRVNRATMNECIARTGAGRGEVISIG